MILSFCVVNYPAVSQQLGTIAGTVLDETGNKVVGAHVIVDPLDERPKASALLVVETDIEGKFSMANLALGSYKVFAGKDSAGYPDTSFAFYSNHIFPTVSITVSSPSANLVLKVGPPAGVLTGLVNDGKDNPIAATFLLRRASDPTNWISLSQRPEYRVLIPPDVDVVIEISPSGYKTLYYGGASDLLKRSPLRLTSREETKLDIQLERDENREKP
jgi:hypothetical protein